MKNLAKIIGEVADLGPMVIFSLEQIGFSGAFWQAEIEVNYTDLFRKKDWDKIYVLEALEERYVMREFAETPFRAVENIAKRFNKVAKRISDNEE